MLDLLIVGASFAGLVAARTAAMRGVDVVVLEAKPDAGAGVATTVTLVKQAAEEIDLPHELTRRVHGVRLYAPSLEQIDLFSPGSFFLTTDTASLLRCGRAAILVRNPHVGWNLASRQSIVHLQ
jgi:digeranylgeranylglycerophospholipid reductase